MRAKPIFQLLQVSWPRRFRSFQRGTMILCRSKGYKDVVLQSLRMIASYLNLSHVLRNGRIGQNVRLSSSSPPPILTACNFAALRPIEAYDTSLKFFIKSKMKAKLGLFLLWNRQNFPSNLCALRLYVCIVVVY